MGVQAARWLEKSAGLVLIACMALWSAAGVSGIVFASSSEAVHPNIYTPPLAELAARSYASPGGIIAQSEGATAVELQIFLGRPVYRVETHAGAQLYDAQSGEALPPISRLTAREAAERVYIGEGRAADIEFIEAPTPSWRVMFDDEEETTLLISRDTGDLIGLAHERSAASGLFSTMFGWLSRGASGIVVSILTVISFAVFLAASGARFVLEKRKP